MSTPSHHPPPEEAERRRRLLTLAIASVSSAVAALVVSRVWGPGTIFGAAMTPVIVTLVGDAIRKPAERIRIVTVTPQGTRVQSAQREADGRLRAQAQPLEVLPPGTTTVVSEAREGPWRPPRRGVIVALATGLIAFVIGVGLLTGSELLFGGSSVAGGDRTTVFGGPSKATQSTPKQQQVKPAPAKTPTRSTPSTTPTTTTGTTTQTAPPAPPPTATAPAPAAPGATATTPAAPSPAAPATGPTGP
jgi:hypothetical protein